MALFGRRKSADAQPDPNQLRKVRSRPKPSQAGILGTVIVPGKPSASFCEVRFRKKYQRAGNHFVTLPLTIRHTTHFSLPVGSPDCPL